MAFWDRFFRKSNAELRRTVHHTLMKSMRVLQAGKQTGGEKFEQQWSWYSGLIKRKEYRTKAVMENLKIIRDLNPDASMAIWNFLRLANSGHTIEAHTPNGKPEKASTDLLNSYAPKVGQLYGGGMDQLINVLLLTAFTQGAIALEVELTEDLRDVVDFHAVDPSTLDFRRNDETNEVELVQKQWDGSYKVLNREQVFYYPIDPDIGDPHGRSPMLPILQIIFFQIEVLKDLKKVIHHQGHQRFDIKVLEEAIIENMPDEIKFQGPEAVRDFVSGYVGDIETQMNQLEPDDDFFHTDSVEIGMAGGAMGSSLDATRVVDIINQQVVTALKQLPILLGRNEGTTETHGTIQWQIYVKGIESIQRGIKRTLEKAYNVALQVKGFQGKAKLTFDALQVTDRLKDAQAEKQETDTKIAQVNQGWIDNDEAANEMVGHDAVSEPIQNVAPSPLQAVPNVAQVNSEPFRTEKKKSNFREDALNVDKTQTDAEKSFSKVLKKQKDLYVKRLKNAPDLPTTVLMEARSLRMVQRDEKPIPPMQFKAWVNSYILSDSPQQIEMWVEEGRTWIENAAILSGAAALLELTTDLDFNRRDQRLLRWLSERSRRSAQLIQGATDEDVLMTLWDVVYEGHFTINKAAKAISESFSFSPARAERIARTEIISAGRAGQYHGDLQSGMVIGKKWRAANQERTRLGHRGANGQAVAFDEPFYVANKDGQMEPLMFPGDSSLGASASNVIQCRCWYERILDGEEIK